ncbi:hypothetical protein BGW80DRAFT_1360046 [Lactifluus volemus]|nr:hypothetical protein BGW80DRAFT_1360046 [Lactifluus volemus]
MCVRALDHCKLTTPRPTRRWQWPGLEKKQSWFIGYVEEFHLASALTLSSSCRRLGL